MSSGVGRRAVGLATGAGVALLAEPLTGLADTAAAGRLGVAAQGALVVAAAVVTTTGWLLNPLLFAQTTEIARATARGDELSAARLLRGGLLAAVALGTALGLLLLLCAGPIVAGLGVDLALREPATDYLQVRALALPVLAAVLTGHGALRGTGDVRGSAAIAVGAALVHATVDVVVVVHTDLGLAGLAAASIVAQLVAAVAMTARLRRHGLLRRSGGPAAGAARAAVRQAWAAGPLALRAIALGIGTIALATAAGRLGAVPAAAHQVTYGVWLAVVLGIEGWKAAAQILVAQATTASERVAVVRTLFRGSVLIGTLAGVGMLATLPLLPPLLAADAATTDQVQLLWPLAAASLIVGSVAFTRDGVEFGLGRYRHNLSRTLRGTACWLAGAAVAVVTEEVAWVWCGVLVGLVARALGDPLRPVRSGSDGEGRIDGEPQRMEAQMSGVDKAKNKAEELKGSAKEQTGEATGNEDLKAEGQADQGKGNVKQAGEKIKDAFR